MKSTRNFFWVPFLCLVSNTYQWRGWIPWRMVVSIVTAFPQVFLKASVSITGTRSHYLLLLDKTWHSKILHNSDNIWITNLSMSSIYHRHWNFVGTYKLSGLSTTETWISYPKPETISSRECGCGCPCLKPNRVYQSCSMPVGLGIREQSQPCLIH